MTSTPYNFAGTRCEYIPVRLHFSSLKNTFPCKVHGMLIISFAILLSVSSSLCPFAVLFSIHEKDVPKKVHFVLTASFTFCESS